eukprot:scaffold18996_cov57-Phaeocystis_antarctica.AAC.8
MIAHMTARLEQAEACKLLDDPVVPQPRGDPYRRREVVVVPTVDVRNVHVAADGLAEHHVDGAPRSPPRRPGGRRPLWKTGWLSLRPAGSLLALRRLAQRQSMPQAASGADQPLDPRWLDPGLFSTYSRARDLQTSPTLSAVVGGRIEEEHQRLAVVTLCRIVQRCRSGGAVAPSSLCVTE